MKKKRNHLFLTRATNISLFSKIILVILIIGMIFSHINFGVFAYAFKPTYDNEILLNENKDLSSLDRLYEETSLRTTNSKTYLKMNGLHEVDFFPEDIHYLDNNEYKEINNTLIKVDDAYINLSNKYQVSFPLELSDGVYLNYKDNEIKILRNTDTNEISLKDIDRNNKNLRDEISYKISDNELLKYKLAQDSIEEDIILESYVENYSYEYYIETNLNVLRKNKKLEFYKNNELVFIMDEYVMYDKDNNISYDINYSLEKVDENTYKVIVIPNNDYLKTASYPVTIDPEIHIQDGGILDGAFSVRVVDMLNNTETLKYSGSFSINNRVNSNLNDDIKAKFNCLIPQYYNISLIDALLNNQFMYAYINLPTVSVNTNTDTTVLVKHEGVLIDNDIFHNSIVFDHKFDVYNVISDALDDLVNGDLQFSFDLTLEGTNYTSVTYSLGGDLTGSKPILTLGYMNEAGLSSFYTYESFNIPDGSIGYVAHNSGNLTYVHNDFSDTLLNLSHIYNANRNYENTNFGNGFSINYNEVISTFYYPTRLKLSYGDGKEVLFSSTDNTINNEFLVNDGSGDKLTKIYTNGLLSGYEIETSSGEVKVYDDNGYLTKIYQDINERVGGTWNNNANSVTLSYNANNKLIQVLDSYNNKIELLYDTTTGKLVSASLYKRNEANTSDILAIEIDYAYNGNNLVEISKTSFLNNDELTLNTNLLYNNLLSQITVNNRGYNISYDARNRVSEVETYSSAFTNGSYINFSYDSNGKRTIITNSNNKKVSYTFDSYNHTNSVTDSNGYTTFYKYNDIYYDEDGSLIASPNYNKNHKIIVSSNSFRNTINPIINHGFEIIGGSGIYGWEKVLTGLSSSTINTNSILYGSSVLDLYKSTNGNAQIYQDINVETGKEYIVSGYIKNTNSGNGAYINVAPISGTFSNVTCNNNIKQTSDFVRFEYRFTSNYTGKARLNLVNESTGHAYFDQIQINTNYIDTRYNYLENSSFENNLSSWSYNNALIVNRSDKFDNNVGSKNLLLKTNGYISKTINMTGSRGNIFVFGGYALYENYTGRVKVSLTINYIIDEVNQVSSKTVSFIFDEAVLNPRYMMKKLEAEYNYSSVTFKVENLSNSSYAYIDNLALYKEGYGINVTYTEDGYIEEEYNELTGDVTTYNYDSDNNLTEIIVNENQTNEERTNISYNDNNTINLIEKDNVTSHFMYDANGNVINTTVDTNDSDNSYKSGSTLYSSNGLFPVSETDIFGHTTNYSYDVISNLLTGLTMASGYQESYTYDAFGNVLSKTSGINNDTRTISYTYDAYGNVTSISDGTTIYTLTYNSYGDIKTISINNNLILTNNYENEDGINSYTGELSSTTYNYGVVSFTYYDDGSIKEVYYNNTKVLSYMYNDYGEISSYKDHKTGITYYYNYDYTNKLINVNSTDGKNVTYAYDDNSNLVSKTNFLGTNIYTYNDDLLASESISNKYKIEYGYSGDNFNNLITISFYLNINSNCSLIDVNYIHETIGSGDDTLLTGRIKEVEYLSNNNEIIHYYYEYDNYTNNILTIEGYTNSTLVYSEENTYDIFGELTHQDIYANGNNYEYDCGYDSRGNLIGYYLINANTYDTIHEAHLSYNLNNELVSAWIDGTNYNMTYSSFGMPSSYLGWNISYYMNQITSISKNNTSAYYSYNAEGIRTFKETFINSRDVMTTYILEGNKIVGETRDWRDTDELYYYYDSSDNLVGFTCNGTKYLYLKNIQNDIIGIVDNSGNIVVKYYYDGYGQLIDYTDTSGIDLAHINPFRYRSYYQDDETGWYYLNSRYYDPLTRRFITMDDISYLGTSGSTLSYNLFSYCENNPVNNVDYNGNISVPRWVVSVPVDAAIMIISSYLHISWAGITQPIKAGARKLGKKFVATSFKNGFFKILNVLKNAILKICQIILLAIKKVIGLFAKKIVNKLSVEVLAATLTGIAISVATNKFLDSIVENITVFLSVGGLIAGFLDWITDKKLDNKIKLDFWR